MIILANILIGIAKITGTIFFIYSWVIIISALLSWVNADPYNPIVRTLRMLTEPVLWRIRKLLPFVYKSGIDFSPVILILFLQFINYALIDNLLDMALIMKAKALSGV